MFKAASINRCSNVLSEKKLLFVVWCKFVNPGASISDTKKEPPIIAPNVALLANRLVFTLLPYDKYASNEVANTPPVAALIKECEFIFICIYNSSVDYIFIFLLQNKQERFHRLLIMVLLNFLPLCQYLYQMS